MSNSYKVPAKMFRVLRLIASHLHPEDPAWVHAADLLKPGNSAEFYKTFAAGTIAAFEAGRFGENRDKYIAALAVRCAQLAEEAI